MSNTRKFYLLHFRNSKWITTTQTLTIIYKTKTFSQKNEINIVTKTILSKILAVCLNFLFIFKVFLLFCNLILKILRQTSFLIKNPFVSFFC